MANKFADHFVKMSANSNLSNNNLTSRPDTVNEYIRISLTSSPNNEHIRRGSVAEWIRRFA